MNAKYARAMITMREFAEHLESKRRFFIGDDAALQALEESIAALKGSANQMRSAEANREMPYGC